jgi:antitoxin component of MazEF toxin-antitoxin module
MAVHDITIQQGATFAKTITITDDDDVAINIANDSFRGQVRKKHSSTDTEANFTMTITDGLNGVVQWSLSATDTASMGNGKFYYDLEWVKADGTVVRILEGIADTTPEVTR